MEKMKYIGAAAALTMLVACNNEELDNSTYRDDPQAVRITAMAGRNEITKSFPVDETNQTAFKDGDKIAVGTEDQDAVTYTNENGTWKPDPAGSYLKWTKSPLTFNAYYPVGENNASMIAFNVPENQDAEGVIEKADYMTFTGSLTKPASSSETVTLTLERKMARVVIDKIEFRDQYATGYSVTDIKVHGNTSGYADGTPKAGNITVASYKTTDGKFYALLSPTTQADSETFLTVTVKADNADDADNGTMLTVKGIPDLAASNSYSYTLMVGKDRIIVSSVTVKEWNDGGYVIDGEGEAEEGNTKFVVNGNTITLLEEGVLTEDAIRQAIGGVVSYGSPAR